LPFDFKIIEETRSDWGVDPMWNTVILLPPKSYSKENLDKLFRFYSRKHPDKKDRLHVEVFTDERNLPPEGIIERYRERPLYPESRVSAYDAIFVRERDMYFLGGEINEWYFYSPDLNNPNETKTVSLKGGRRYRPREVLETWEFLIQKNNIRVQAYNLKHIDPHGVYYAFEYLDERYGEWYGIFTFQQPDQVPIPRRHIRSVSEQVSFIFMGWMYAVTTDGGQTWSLWDAEYDLPMWHGRDYDFIKDVKIEPDGSGIMKVGPLFHHAREVDELYTKDYGQTWSVYLTR